MRTAALALLVALAGVLASEPADAHGGRTRVHIGVGFGYPYWGPYWGPWYYPPPYYYHPAPAVVVREPVTYIEQGGGTTSAPSAQSGNWWYYCEGSKGYYPYVKECPSGWQRVPPAPPSAK
jgi:hypothetical protein